MVWWRADGTCPIRSQNVQKYVPFVQNGSRGTVRCVRCSRFDRTIDDISLVRDRFVHAECFIHRTYVDTCQRLITIGTRTGYVRKLGGTTTTAVVVGGDQSNRPGLNVFAGLGQRDVILRSCNNGSEKIGGWHGIIAICYPP